ncbi:MAG: hypothetical protein LBS21_10705 [Clostridiales bacterium]|jgi:hypothetical protein|nr:hypothetical protein [Clostridiales bacterium]
MNPEIFSERGELHCNFVENCVFLQNPLARMDFFGRKMYNELGKYYSFKAADEISQ